VIVTAVYYKGSKTQIQPQNRAISAAPKKDGAKKKAARQKRATLKKRWLS
jgi:hypothetical protein